MHLPLYSATPAAVASSHAARSAVNGPAFINARTVRDSSPASQATCGSEERVLEEGHMLPEVHEERSGPCWEARTQQPRWR